MNIELVKPSKLYTNRVVWSRHISSGKEDKKYCLVQKIYAKTKFSMENINLKIHLMTFESFDLGGKSF